MKGNTAPVKNRVDPLKWNLGTWVRVLPRLSR
ncbi:hypothetical protein GMOD_00002600 [Pyrenophora seminiperda CCB06]|uniref:Uncharacterized protein n=1 Tax=Pyrenophora seminiperda CCB06 TaxID=1302712 RepID=A0A3M7M2Q1_9PLEO|nr:hypothetical protein GMOD_00002600 [Pyrenophora seminiperda CCB06]